MDYQDMQTEEMNIIQPEPNQPAAPEATRKQPPNNMATASLVLGIIALVTFCCYYTVLPLGGLSILFAILSRPDGKFTGQAKAGMILSVIAIALAVVFWVVFITYIMGQVTDTAVQNMPMIPPSIPDVTEGLDNVLTAFWRLPIGGVR